jgi:hypothetical protein
VAAGDSGKPSAPEATALVAQSYVSTASLLAAMAAHGAVCFGASFRNGGTVSGEVNPFAECSGSSNGDTAVVVFTDHASALAYAQDMLGENLGPAAEVVGPDWTVTGT